MEITSHMIFKNALDWAKSIIIALVIALLIRYFVFSPFVIPTGSMIPTIQINDKIIALKFSYWLAPVKRDDIIVFRAPNGVRIPTPTGYKENALLVKRVIGLGGETIEIKNGQLYINNVLQSKPYIYEPIKQDFGPYTIPKDCYFVMGDNTNGSHDARSWKQKYITKDLIIGKAVYKFGGLK